MNLKTWEVIYE